MIYGVKAITELVFRSHARSVVLVDADMVGAPPHKWNRSSAGGVTGLIPIQ